MQFNDSKVTGTGTVTTAGTTTLTGSGTLFLSELQVGDEILVSGEGRRTIDAIASDTSLTVTVAFATSVGSLTFEIYDRQDLYHDYLEIIGGDSLTAPLKTFTRNANLGMNNTDSLIMRSDNGWKWDDSNRTDLPIGTKALVANQEDYSIDATQLKILKVRIKDRQGNLVTLDPVDRKEISDAQLTEAAGDPKRYWKQGNSIFLNPKPSYGYAAGLEVQFQRGGSYFVVGDTTKEPGFARQFHRLISLYPALDYADTNNLDKLAAKIQLKITKLENELLAFYSDRANDKQPHISMEDDDYGELSDDLSATQTSNPDGF